MAPPDRGDRPTDVDNTEYLAAVNLAENPRLGHNANLLASWVEWLLHPETHDYDRTVIYPDGTKRDEPGPVTKANPLPGNYEPVELDYESVIAGYYLSQFLDPMVAVSSQKVEGPDSMLSTGAAALKNVWWLGNEHAIALSAGFPVTEWTGAAATNAHQFVIELSDFATQVNKIVDEFHHTGARYAVVTRALRENLDKAAGELIAAFEQKFHEKPEGISLDVVGIILSAAAAGAVTYMTGGAGLPLLQSAFTGAWSATFTQTFDDVLKRGSQGSVAGSEWRDLVETYLRTVADMVMAATEAMNDLNTKIVSLLRQFDAEVAEFLGEGVA